MPDIDNRRIRHTLTGDFPPIRARLTWNSG